MIAALKLEPTRVWRTYTGGSRLDSLEGKKEMISSFPEDWIASSTRAVNAGREDIIEEGLSKIMGEGRTLASLIESERKEMLGSEEKKDTGFLMKLIDSSERLTIQVHPTRDDALRLFGSKYGKTESWYFLGDNDAYIYLGFKEGITRGKWEEVFEKQDLALMLGMLNKIKVRKGDTVLICGGVPHAIGVDCFVCELQEPTDISIRTERTTPGGFRIADKQCHQGIGFEKMFDVFKYEAMTEDEIRQRYFLRPQEYYKDEFLTILSLIPYSSTPYFKMRKIISSGRSFIERPEKCCVWYILDGEGSINGVDFVKHDRFFIPSSLRRIDVCGSFSLIECYGPKEKGDEDL